jgi:hypothetical protein
VHIDEFASKMGDDDDIVVVSFFVRDLQAAKDLVSWFEKGYDFVLDADRSPGEIKPSRYLVYAELRRRPNVAKQVGTLIEDLGTLTEFDAKDWTMRYDGKTQPWSVEAMSKTVPLTPADYRSAHGDDLNDVRKAAGIEPKKVHKPTPETLALQSAAGIR